MSTGADQTADTDRALADLLAAALKQMIPGTHYRRRVRAEALAAYEAARIDGEANG